MNRFHTLLPQLLFGFALIANASTAVANDEPPAAPTLYPSTIHGGNLRRYMDDAKPLVVDPIDPGLPKQNFSTAPQRSPSNDLPRTQQEIPRWQERRMDKFQDQYLGGFGTFKQEQGGSKLRFDYLRSDRCKIKGWGICLRMEMP